MQVKATGLQWRSLDLVLMGVLKVRPSGRVRAMARFTSAKSCQMFVSIPAWIHNHFNLERQLYNGEQFKSNRAAALNEWRQRAR